MTLNKDLVLREVGGEYMIVNPFSDTVDMTKVYSLNETAAWLWQQMEGKEFTVADMVMVLQEEYEVDEETGQPTSPNSPNTGSLPAWHKNNAR